MSELTGEKKSLSQKAELLTKKIQWLRKNEKILTTLYSCCALQGVGGENLPGTKVVLVYLLYTYLLMRLSLLELGSSIFKCFISSVRACQNCLLKTAWTL